MNIALYYTHCESLGHTTRVFNIVKELNKNNSVMVLQAGKKQEYFNDKYAKIIHLPNPTYGKHYFYRGYAKQKDMEALKKRVSLMKKHLDDFKPDIFVTEFFPFGREHANKELVPLIKYLRSKYPKLKICASIGYPVISQKKEKLLEIAELYDKLLIHCPKGLDYECLLDYLKTFSLEMNQEQDQTADEYMDIFKKLKEKIIFTGYVVNKIKPSGTNKEFVLISRGAGVVNPKIIVDSILAKKYLPNIEFRVVAGPASSEKEYGLFTKLSKKFKNIKMFRYIGNFPKMLSECGVSISMSGYNSCVETLFLKKPNILFPRIRIEGDIEIEQGYRAELMKKLTGSTIMNQTSTTPKTLADAITAKLNDKTKINTKNEWFEGAENTSKILADLV